MIPADPRFDVMPPIGIHVLPWKLCLHP